MNSDLVKQIEETKQLIESTDDQGIVELAKEELAKLTRELAESNPINQRNVIMEIRAGTGGDEAELFAGELFRLYQRYSERKGWKFELLDSSRSELGGLKSATILIKGTNAFADLKYEGGVMRVQRVPKTEKSGRVHTSAATVAVLPEAKDVDVQIKPQELRIDVYRSSGHGGQSVNTTDSAVRITHLPTNIVVTCQDERSQLKNKDKAMAVLRSKLWEVEQSKQDQSVGDLRREMIKSGDRSDKVRTFNYPQSRVTDHRVNKSWHNLEGILDGGIEPIIEALKEADLTENDG